MKVINANYAISDLAEAGIAAIYYNANGDWIIEYSGAWYASSVGDVEEEVETLVSELVAKDGGEEVGADDVKSLKSNIGFEWDEFFNA